MSLYSTQAPKPAPPAQETLAILAVAMDGRSLEAAHRVAATRDSRNPDEGLALLSAYTAIADPAIRQAVLDVMLTISGIDPYR